MENQKQLEELQFLEQNMQNILFQKQAFQIELSETQSALAEIEKSDDEVYKIIGQLMIKTEKSSIKEELTNKEKILSLRLKSLEKQESNFTDKISSLREEMLSSEKFK